MPEDDIGVAILLGMLIALWGLSRLTPIFLDSREEGGRVGYVLLLIIGALVLIANFLL